MKYKGNRLIVADAGWAETIPAWLLEDVKSERMTLGLVNIIDSNISAVGDAEICVYLYTLSLRQPLHHEYAEIYLFLAASLMKKRGMSLADFMEEKLQNGLSKEEQRQLEELRNRIYSIRGDIQHPLFDVLRKMKKGIETGETTETETATQLTLI